VLRQNQLANAWNPRSFPIDVRMKSSTALPLFEVREVSVSFSEKPLWSSLSLTIAQGEKIVLRGPSGCGKSTLLKMLLGFVQPDEGRIILEGLPMTPSTAWKLRRRTAYADQKVDPVSGKVSELLASFPGLKGDDHGGTSEGRKKAIGLMERLGLSGKVVGEDAGSLSGGELQRVVLAAILSRERNILLLDEPTAALDGVRKQQLADLFLKEHPDKTLIVASHDEVWNQPDLATVVELRPDGVQ